MVNDNKKYTAIADLLTDDGFLAWQRGSNNAAAQHWNKWVAEKPEHAALAKQAAGILSVLLQPAAGKVSKQAVNASFERLVKKMMVKGKKMHSLI